MSFTVQPHREICLGADIAPTSSLSGVAGMKAVKSGRVTIWESHQCGKRNYSSLSGMGGTGQEMRLNLNRILHHLLKHFNSGFL